MLLRILRLTCLLLAAAFSVACLVIAWLILSFGGVPVTWFGLSILMPPALCLPLFVLFCFQRRWGIILLTLNMFWLWMPDLIATFPRISLRTLVDSGLDKFVLGSLVFSLLAYVIEWQEKLIKLRNGALLVK